MTQNEIINGSKLIAEYLGYQYVPFSADLKHKKAGWYQVKSAKPNIQKAKLRSKNTTTGEETVEELEIDVNFIKFNNKNGWILVGDNYYKFVCRKHSDLRFYNSWDSLMLAVNKILNTQFEDTEYYRFRTFGLRCEETNEFMVRFERFQLFKSSSLLEATFKAVMQIIENK